MAGKQRAYTRKLLRGKRSAAEAPEAPVSFRLSKRWQRHDAEMRRNTEGCAPDLENLP